MVELFKKVAEMKKKIGKISKDSTNPFYSSRYFDVNQLLEHLEPLFESHGLLLLQPIMEDEVCTIIVDLETGDKLQSRIKLTQFNDPQKTGSAITYYRRYSLQSLLGLQSEDDDANKTVERGAGKARAAGSSKPKTSDKSSDDGKPWLNLTDKAGNKTDIFNKILAKAETEEVTVARLKLSFKISKKDIATLAEHNIV